MHIALSWDTIFAERSKGCKAIELIIKPYDLFLQKHPFAHITICTIFRSWFHKTIHHKAFIWLCVIDVNQHISDIPGHRLGPRESFLVDIIKNHIHLFIWWNPSSWLAIPMCVHLAFWQRYKAHLRVRNWALAPQQNFWIVDRYLRILTDKAIFN